MGGIYVMEMKCQGLLIEEFCVKLLSLNYYKIILDSFLETYPVEF